MPPLHQPRRPEPVDRSQTTPEGGTVVTGKNPVPDKDDPGYKPFTIQIDRTKYEWSEEKISGAQLRNLPEPPIPRERDIFLVVPGHPDRKIKDDDTVEVHDGLRFFTAPNTINPGSDSAGSESA